jgi:hypothetical protein
MSITPGDMGGGGPIPVNNGICQPSPSDLAGSIYNLLDRIKFLEDKVTMMLGANINANSLSDISQQIGWVTGLTYAGVGGWTQTPAGTLIPPSGFSLSDMGWTLPNACTGEDTPYQGVVMDDQGVLQFGFTPAGEMCGTKVEDWDAAAANGGPQDYGMAWITTGGNGSQSRGVAIGDVFPDSIVMAAGRAGVYAVGGHIDVNYAPGGPKDCVYLMGPTPLDPGSASENGLYTRSYTSDTGLTLVSLSLSGVVVLNAGEEVMSAWGGIMSGGTVDNHHFHMVRVSG